jgi:hypothetical protein
MSEDNEILRNKKLAYRREWYRKNIIKERERARTWQNNHPDVRKRNNKQYYEGHVESQIARGPLRVKFKGKRIYLRKVPRVGVCNLCRAVVEIDCETTHMHHEKYDSSDPLKHSMEICPAHHNAFTFKWDNKERIVLGKALP